ARARSARRTRCTASRAAAKPAAAPQAAGPPTPTRLLGARTRTGKQGLDLERRIVTTLAEVRLWGRAIGAVSVEDAAGTAAFQYTPEFARSGIEVAPLMMPLDERIYAFPTLARET